MRTQYAIVRIKDNKLIGYIAGKTTIDDKNYFLYYEKNKLKKIEVGPETDKLYRIDVQRIG